MYDPVQNVRSQPYPSSFVSADSGRQVFCLTCPTAKGQQMDEALWNAISKYVKAELAAVELENVSTMPFD